MTHASALPNPCGPVHAHQTLLTLEQARDLCGQGGKATGEILWRAWQAQDANDSLLTDYLMHHLRTREPWVADVLTCAPWAMMEARLEMVQQGSRFPWLDPTRAENVRPEYSGCLMPQDWHNLKAWYRVLMTYNTAQMHQEWPLWSWATLATTLAYTGFVQNWADALLHVCGVQEAHRGLIVLRARHNTPHMGRVVLMLGRSPWHDSSAPWVCHKSGDGYFLNLNDLRAAMPHF
jgi:hypothetical protein